MKTLSIFFIALFCAITAFAQAPQSFSYQAIANNASGAPVVNGSVKVRISILDNTATGTVLYTETHAKTTNAQGLFNLNIGQGTVAAGTFSGINWGVNPKFVKVELDPAGGTNYTTVGTSQFQSVPYAMYADKVNPANVTSALQSLTTKTGKQVVVYTASEARAFYQTSTGSGFWTTTSLNGTPLGIVASNKSIVVYTASEARAFYQTDTGSGFWTTTSLNGTPLGAIASGDNIIIYTASEARAFYQTDTGSGFWSTTSLNGPPLGVIAK
jgi:hypothetical protein